MGVRGSSTDKVRIVCVQIISCDTHLVRIWLDFGRSKQYLKILFVKVTDTNAPKCLVNSRAAKKTRECREAAPC